MLANLDLVVRHIVRRPDAVIVTLDADDCLLRTDALSAVHRLHLSGGHDLVIGGQLRTDRTASPAANAFGTANVVFGGPPRQRALRGGGEVWRHLRSFRKYLYDKIRTENLIDPASMHATGTEGHGHAPSVPASASLHSLSCALE